MTSFLLPPGIFLLIGMGALILSVKIKRNIFLPVQSIFLLLIYLLSIRPISDWCLSPLEDQFPLRDDSFLSAQYIVILGGGSINRFDNLTLSSDATKRVVEGYILHRKTGLPIILS